MNPIRFASANTLFGLAGEQRPEESSLPVINDGQVSTSFWEPTEEERAAIAGGALVQLDVQAGTGHPPVAMGIAWRESELLEN